MKNIIAGAGLLALVSSAAMAAQPITENKVWTETFPLNTTTPKLIVSNIWGNVRVRPGDVDEITITVDESRSAPDQERFDRSLESLKLNIAADSNGVSLEVGVRDREWERHDPCRGCRVDFQFEVLVPPGTELDVGTVMAGTVDVAGIAGMISASNVNGPISIREMRDCNLLESVNGEVDVSFALAPGQNCNIETINGDITMVLPNGSGLDVALDLFNGRMISEFSVDPFALPAQIEHTSTNGRHRYRVQQSAGLRLDGGGPTFTISSLNGDIRIQKSR